MEIFYYKEMLLRVLQSTGEYCVSGAPFSFWGGAEAVLGRAVRLRGVFGAARHSAPRDGFVRRSGPCYMGGCWHASAQRGV